MVCVGEAFMDSSMASTSLVALASSMDTEVALEVVGGAVVSGVGDLVGGLVM